MKEMKNKGADMFFRAKPAMALIHAADSYLHKISKEIDATYPHTVRIIMELEKIGLVKTEKRGRVRHTKHTEKGWKVTEHIKALHELLM